MRWRSPRTITYEMRCSKAPLSLSLSPSLSRTRVCAPSLHCHCASNTKKSPANKPPKLPQSALPEKQTVKKKRKEWRKVKKKHSKALAIPFVRFPTCEFKPIFGLLDKVPVRHSMTSKRRSSFGGPATKYTVVLKIVVVDKRLAGLGSCRSPGVYAWCDRIPLPISTWFQCGAYFHRQLLQ